MKQFFVVLFLLTTQIAISQNITFPVKDNSIHYNNIVITNNTTTPESIVKNIVSWADKNKSKFTFVKKANPAIGNLITYMGSMRVDPDNGDYRAVDCSFTLELTVIDGRYRYEIFDFKFIKNGILFDASEIYLGYLKKEPVVKTAFEKPEEALKRHEHLLGLLQKKVNDLIDSLKKAIEK